MADSFALGAARIEPVYHDAEATLDKIRRWIERAASAEARDTCDIDPTVRGYAFETRSFVASRSAYIGDGIPDGFEEGEIGFGVGDGGSMHVNPAGIVKAGPAGGTRPC